MKQAIHTAGAPKAVGFYSQATVSVDLIFTAGQIHLTPEGKLIHGSTEDKVAQIMKNLNAILKEAGSGFDKVVKATVYVTDMSIMSELNEAYASYLSEPFPAREAVCVSALPLGAEIEISMIATVA